MPLREVQAAPRTRAWKSTVKLKLLKLWKSRLVGESGVATAKEGVSRQDNNVSSDISDKTEMIDEKASNG